MKIDPKDLRPGDRFRMTDALEGIVARNVNGVVYMAVEHGQMGYSHQFKGGDRTWDLLGRPREPLTVWRDPGNDNVEYVLLRSGRYVSDDSRVAQGYLFPVHDANIIDRLIPAEQDGE